MSAGTAGYGAAVMDLYKPKVESPLDKIRPPGASFKVKGWKLVGAVLRIPASPTLKRTVGFDSPSDGVAFLGPLVGYCGLSKRKKDNPLAIEFPASKYARLVKGYDRHFFNNAFAIWGKNTELHGDLGAPEVHDELFLSTIAVTKNNVVWPISIQPNARELYGLQWAYDIVPKNKVIRLPYWVKTKLKGIKVHNLSYRKKAIKVSTGFGVTCGWRAWCIAGRHKGSVLKVIKDFFTNIPDDYKPFKKFYYGGEFVRG